MLLNLIENYNLKFYKEKIMKTYPILISSLSFVNKSLIISMFSFSTAIYNAVLWNCYLLKIIFKDIILNFIWKYVFF